MAATACHDCGKKARSPQVVPFLNLERRRLKNGKLGKERKVQRKERLCGYCFVMEYTRPDALLGDKEMIAMREEVMQLRELALSEIESPANGANANGASPGGNGHGEPLPRGSLAGPANFDKVSPAKAKAVEDALGCECVAYVDVFSYRRWQGQGFQVIRGQKSIGVGRIPLFCRCQVQAVTA